MSDTAPREGITPLQRTLMTWAAVLFFIGLLTGAWAGAVLTDGRALMIKLPAHTHTQERAILASHLNALLGCFWILGFAWTVEHTSLSPSLKLWAGRLTILANYANWLVTLVKSVIDVKGLEMSTEQGGAGNVVIAVALMLGVVLPGLAASGLWAWGLVKKKPSA